MAGEEEADSFALGVKNLLSSGIDSICFFAWSSSCCSCLSTSCWGGCGGRVTEEIVGAKVTCFALVVDVFEVVAEKAELEEGGGGRALEGVV